MGEAKRRREQGPHGRFRVRQGAPAVDVHRLAAAARRGWPVVHLRTRFPIGEKYPPNVKVLDGEGHAPWTPAERQRVDAALTAWWATRGLTCGYVQGLDPWQTPPAPDYRTMFHTATGAVLLFHFTHTAHVEPILQRGFEDRTSRVGWDARPSAHAVYFGAVPPIPGCIDCFHPEHKQATDTAWLVVEAPAAAWPDQALSHDQESCWPLYQVAYPAALVNTWPRRRLAVEDVVGYRPGLLLEYEGDGGKFLEFAIAEGWLPADLLAQFHRNMA